MYVAIFYTAGIILSYFYSDLTDFAPKLNSLVQKGILQALTLVSIKRSTLLEMMNIV